ncbi:preprotein translocase subunit SecG [Candidatus Vallotia tarda]|uniref:Protein-export membrane protein SecG n=1 Tax=Candidatus Vallotiella hemipterorum TaxID=1177213 RepID=A0A916JT74_9BURK|nr:preprotein translocase subunit SecG [Candidatus Vallotia tarda]CAG7601055.1 Protein-export membrane protein SecG [Candidatus Vallotia tarda]
MHFLFLKTLIIVVQVLSALGVIGLVLLQHDKAANIGMGFGSGASGSLFSASGSVDFLSRATAIFATVFFISTLFMSVLGGNYPPKMPRSGLLSSAAPLAVTTPVEGLVSSITEESTSHSNVPK